MGVEKFLPAGITLGPARAQLGADLLAALLEAGADKRLGGSRENEGRGLSDEVEEV
jgi:hypothetical protein